MPGPSALYRTASEYQPPIPPLSGVQGAQPLPGVQEESPCF